jgi:hypothetical protein
MAKVIGSHVPRRRRLHRDHRTVYRLSLARDLVDLPFRPLPESMPMRLMHLPAAPPEQRPHPPAPIAGMALGQPPFEAGILLSQLTQPLGVWDNHATELLAPAVAGRLCNTVRTA